MCLSADSIRKKRKDARKKEDILELLEEFGKVIQQITKRIGQEANMDILSRWHKYAARVSSISEFEINM